MTNPIHHLRTFYEETVLEVKKCTWPTRQELIEHTGIVIAIVVLLTTFIFVVDQVCGFLIKTIMA